MRKRLFQLVVVGFILLALVMSWGEPGSVVAQPGTASRIHLPLITRPPAGLVVSQVKVIQGTSASTGYAVYIAGRETLVRVFVGTTNGSSVSGVTARLCGYAAGGQSLGCIYADNSPVSTPSQEGSLGSTLNFRLPLAWVEPGFAFQVDLNPVDLDPNHTSGAGHFPLSGKQAVNFVSVPDLDIVVIPINYRPYQSSQTFVPETDNLSYLTYLAIKVFPVSTIQYYDHAFFAYAPAGDDENLDEAEGWIKLLTNLTNLHNMEDPTGQKNYYGLVNSYQAHGCTNGCITGIGWLGGSGKQKSALGWSGFGAGTLAASETMIHELGHNFGRKHVACSGKEGNVDGSYPYSGGLIGQFGLDVVDGDLYQPDEYADYMSYCDKTWTSDYTYWNIYKYRQNTQTSSATSTEAVEALYVSGIISPEGAVSLQPVYSQWTQIPAFTAGSHRLEVLDSNGRTAASYAFTPYEMADSGGYSGFGFFLPAEDDLGGLRVLQGGQILAEKYAAVESKSLDMVPESWSIDRSASQPRLRLPDAKENELVYRIRGSQDGGQTWEVLALDWTEAMFPLAAELDGGLVEIQSSDGLHTQTVLLDLGESD
ncbi:MAG TPA: hypothetical protein VFZ76_20090 [Anaerolineales bacterium]